MEFNLLTKLQEKIADQQWYLELKGKWDALNSQTQFMVQIGAGVAVALGTVLIVWSTVSSTLDLRAQIKAKQSLIELLNRSVSEGKTGQSGTPADADAKTADGWKPVIEEIAAKHRIEKTAIEWVSEKPLSGMQKTKETLLEFKIKDAELRAIVALSVDIERQPSVIRIRQLVMDRVPKSDKIAALVSLSAFK